MNKAELRQEFMRGIKQRQLQHCSVEVFWEYVIDFILDVVEKNDDN